MSNSTRLQGKFAFITGASRGIGRAVAERFAAEGAAVALNHFEDDVEAQMTLAELHKISKQSGHSAKDHIVLEADVSNRPAIESAMNSAIDCWGKIDVAINNAGIQSSSPSDDPDLVAFERIIAVNLLGATNVATLALKHFRTTNNPGVIINTSSVHEIIPKPTYLAYSISKGGMSNLTRTLALEFAEHGIRVNAVAPGAILTDINDAWKDDPKKRAEVESHIPLGRAAHPEKIASVYAFLASDEAAYMTGQTLYVCGGLTLYPEFRKNWSS